MMKEVVILKKQGMSEGGMHDIVSIKLCRKRFPNKAAGWGGERGGKWGIVCLKLHHE